MRGASATVPWGWCQAGHLIIRVTGSQADTTRYSKMLCTHLKVHKIGTLLYIKDSAGFVLCHDLWYLLFIMTLDMSMFICIMKEKVGSLMLPLVCASILTIVLCEVIGASMVRGAQVSVLRLLSWTTRHGTQTSFDKCISCCFYSFTQIWKINCHTVKAMSSICFNWMCFLTNTNSITGFAYMLHTLSSGEIF